MVGGEALPATARASCAAALQAGAGGSMAIRLLIADDQAIIRRGIVAILQHESDIEVLGEAADAGEALEKAVALRPNLVLMEIMLPGGDGIATTRAIRERCPETQVLILTSNDRADVFQKAAGAGALGYLLKDVSPANLVSAVRAVHNGNAALSPRIANRMMADFRASHDTQSLAPARRLNGLTERETDVLTGLASGLSDKEIAAKLYLSEATVKTHLRLIYQRFKLRNRVQAAAFAVERGLISPKPPAGAGR